MRKVLSRLDYLLLLSTLLLITISVFMVYSTSIGSGNPYAAVIRQASYAVVGLALGGIIIYLGYRFFLGFSWLLYSGVLFLLLITFFLGIETRGSTRWIDFGFFTLQGSELAKPVLILFLTQFFAHFSPLKLHNMVFSLILTALPAALVFLQPDLGSAMIIVLIWIGLVYLAGVRLRYFFGLFGLGVVSLPIAFNFLKSYQQARVLSFLNPTADPLGAGYNVVQSIIAVGSGQFFGRGFGRGTQSHLNFLPEQKTDFIFATTAEELGFVGVAIILILFAVVIWRLLVIGSRSQTKAGSLICYGTAIVLSAQVFVNAGMNMGLLPVTGITLPFISFGGSSMVSMLILMGLAQSVYLDKG